MVRNDRDDKTLVMLTLAGDQNAYEELVHRYEKIVVASARTVIQSQYMAEDAAQDAFITAWMKLDRLMEPEKYGAWVCRIAGNCAKNTVSRFKSYMSLDMLEDMVTDERQSGDPEMAFISEEEKRLLKGLIKKLEK